MTLSREALAARLDRAEEKARKLKEDRLAREVAQADAKARKASELSHLTYRMKYLPQQLEDARRKLAALENEARRYRMFDLLETGQ